MFTRPSRRRQGPTARARGAEGPSFRHIRARPQVSATYLPGEELAVTVHGRAVPIDVAGERNAGFRRTLLEIYVPRYGPQWEDFLDSGPVYARIDAEPDVHLSMPPGP